MAKQQAPDGREYEYSPTDATDVARVAALCEPSYEDKRARAQAAFEAVAPEAARLAAANAPAPAISAADINDMIRAAIRDALGVAKAPEVKQQAPAVVIKDAVDPGDVALGADKSEGV